MKKIKKKLLSCVLTMSIILSMFMGMSFTAKAADTSGLPTSGDVATGTYTLTDNVILDGALVIPSGKEVTIDLKGHTIDRNLATATADGYVIEVSGKLTLTDSSAGKTGTITGGKNDNSVGSKGGGVYIAGGSLTMNGGTISGNDAGEQGDGGGVYISAGASFIMKGGVITGNTASRGGGVYNRSGKFNMTDGTITGNKATDKGGGGVYNNNGDFDMRGGSITENTASGSNAPYGGGVYSEGSPGYGTFTMTGGAKVINNSASSNGGGVYVNGAKFTVGGSAQVTGNTLRGADNNVELSTNGNTKVALGTGVDVPVSGMSIGVNYPSLGSTPYTLIESGATESTKNYFTADISTQYVAFDNGKLLLKLLEATGEIKIDESGVLTVGGVTKSNPDLAAMGLAYSYSGGKATLTFQTAGGINPVIRGSNASLPTIHSMVDLEIVLSADATVLFTDAGKDAIIVGDKANNTTKNLTISGGHTLNVKWQNNSLSTNSGIGIYADNLTVNSGTTLDVSARYNGAGIKVGSLNNNGTIKSTNTGGAEEAAAIGFESTLKNNGDLFVYTVVIGIVNIDSGGTYELLNNSNITVDNAYASTAERGIKLTDNGTVTIGERGSLKLKGSSAAYIGPEITTITENHMAKVLGNTHHTYEANTPAIFGRATIGHKEENTYVISDEAAKVLKVICVPAPAPGPGPAPAPGPGPTPTPGPGNYYPTQTTPQSALQHTPQNIQISGDSSIKVSASVNGNKVTVGDITTETINSIIKSGSNNKENTEITIDLSALNNIKQTVFTKETLNNISKVLNDNSNNKTSFEIKLKDSTVRIDPKALSAIALQAEGKDLSFNISKTGDIISLSIVSNGKEISDFKGGIVTIGINNFSLSAGKKAENYHAYYKPKIGEPVRMPTWIKDRVLFFTTGHFSDYEIVYDESIKNGEAKHVYRLYNPGNGEHFLTVSKAERDACEKAGWIYEGIAFDVFNDGKKVYRLFNRATGEHFFTADQVEKDALVNAGWILEGAALISEGETEVYRLLNPGGMHMFTTSAKERDALVKTGWIYEGIGFKAN